MKTARSAGSRAAIVLLGSVAITLAIFLLPSPEHTWWLLAPFRWLHIYVHEYGHGMAALLSGGSFDSFELYTQSGLAHTAVHSALAHAFVCAGGLCGPAVVGGLFLACGRRPRLARIALGLFGGFMAVSLLLWTRTAFGWGFGAAVAVISLAIALRGQATLAQTALVFVGVQLALSVYTGGGYLFTQAVTIQNGYRGPSDVQVMAEALGGPYWLWGALCAGFSVVALAAGLWVYLRPARASAEPRAAQAVVG